MLGITRDISERKKLERQRADFHAMVTHDLKSPLITILGYSELISTAAQGVAGGEVINEMAKAVSRGGDRLLRLVDDFMAVSKIEAGGIELRVAPTDAVVLLHEVRDDFEPIARKKGIVFRVDIPDSLPVAILDKKQVERAVGNLLQNAFNYTPKGGEVTLKAETALRGVDKYILISVSDTGPGIPYDDMDKIFDKYYRSPKTAGYEGNRARPCHSQGCCRGARRQGGGGKRGRPRQHVQALLADKFLSATICLPFTLRLLLHH